MQLVKLQKLLVALWHIIPINGKLIPGDGMRKEQTDKYKCLGLNIAYYRKQRGMSQDQLAEAINISRTHMSRVETADCAVSLDVVFDICDALGVPPAKLFDFRS